MGILATIGIAGLGAIMLIVFGVFYRLGIFATTRAILGFLGTICLGVAGLAGHLLHAVVMWAVTLAGAGTTAVVGASLGGFVIAFVSGAYFVHDLHPKHQTYKRTGWAGIILAAVLVAGASGIPALNGVPAKVQQGVTNARTVLGG